MKRLFFIVLGLGLAFCAMTSAAQAQATRTWVSGVGDDANPCSRTAPCKTFPGAYSRTAVGGEIDALDPGGFGTVTISKSLTIDGGGAGLASILASSTNAVVINGGASDVITLRNIQIQGIRNSSFPGLTGIVFNSGLVLNLEHVVIENFQTGAINFQPTVRAFMHIVDCNISNSGGDGIIITTAASGGGNNGVDIKRTSIIDSGGNGVRVTSNSRVSLSEVVISHSGSDGLLVNGGSPTVVGVDYSTIQSNSGNGIHTQNSGAVRLSTSTVVDNTLKGVFTDTGQIYTHLDNRLLNNFGGDGTFTGPFPMS
jgi:hypothetical protein